MPPRFSGKRGKCGPNHKTFTHRFQVKKPSINRNAGRRNINTSVWQAVQTVIIIIIIIIIYWLNVCAKEIIYIVVVCCTTKARVPLQRLNCTPPEFAHGFAYSCCGQIRFTVFVQWTSILYEAVVVCVSCLFSSSIYAVFKYSIQHFGYYIVF